MKIQRANPKRVSPFFTGIKNRSELYAFSILLMREIHTMHKRFLIHNKCNMLLINTAIQYIIEIEIEHRRTKHRRRKPWEQ